MLSESNCQGTEQMPMLAPTQRRSNQIQSVLPKTVELHTVVAKVEHVPPEGTVDEKLPPPGRGTMKGKALPLRCSKVAGKACTGQG